MDKAHDITFAEDCLVALDLQLPGWRQHLGELARSETAEQCRAHEVPDPLGCSAIRTRERGRLCSLSTARLGIAERKKAICLLRCCAR